MNRRVVIDPAHAALAPENFRARAQAILESLPDDWDTAACVAYCEWVERPVLRQRFNHRSHADWQYMGPRWVFLKGGTVTTYCRTFEAMENIPDISRINPEVVRNIPKNIPRTTEQRYATHLSATG